MTSVLLFIAVISSIVVLGSDFFTKRFFELKEHITFNNEIYNKLTNTGQYTTIETILALTIYHYMMFKIITHRFHLYMICVAVILSFGMNIMYSGVYDENINNQLFVAITLGIYGIMVFLKSL